MMRNVAIVAFLLSTLFASMVSAATPDLKLPYQKQLTAAPTTSTTATPVTFKFSLFDAQIDGTKYWEETQTVSVTKTTRLISVNLGDTGLSPLKVSDFANQLWVQVELNGVPVGTRDKLVVAPYAIWSATSNASGEPGPQGPKGDTGPVGPQGPAGTATLAALNLTACTAYDGSPSKLSISVATDGTVSFKCAIAPKFVFVTSQAFTGNLGGLAGADRICQSLASAAGLSGVYKAWLSDSTSSPATRFTHSAGNYIEVDGTVLASDWSSFVANGYLQAPIDRDETGHAAAVVASGGTQQGGVLQVGDCGVWNNTKWNGTALLPLSGGPATAISCNDWSVSTANFIGESSFFGVFPQCGLIPRNI